MPNENSAPAEEFSQEVSALREELFQKWDESRAAKLVAKALGMPENDAEHALKDLHFREAVLAVENELANPCGELDNPDASTDREWALIQKHWKAHGYKGKLRTKNSREGRILCNFLAAVKAKGEEGREILAATGEYFRSRGEVKENAREARKAARASAHETASLAPKPGAQVILVDGADLPEGTKAWKVRTAGKAAGTKEGQVYTLATPETDSKAQRYEVTEVREDGSIAVRKAKAPAAVLAPAPVSDAVSAPAVQAVQEKAAESGEALSSEEKKGIEIGTAVLKSHQGTSLSENPEALGILASFLKIFRDLLAKLGMNAPKELNEALNQTDAKLAMFEWGDESPKGEEGKKDQAEKKAKNEKALADWNAKLAGAKDAKALEMLNPSLENLKKGYQYEANKAKFQAAFDARAAELANLAAPKAPETLTLSEMSPEQKADAVVAAVGALKDGQSLNDAGRIGAAEIFHFDPAAPAAVLKDENGHEFKYQEVSILGEKFLLDLNTDTTSELLSGISRRAAAGEDGVNFDGGHMPMGAFRENLVTMFAGGSFTFRFSDKKQISVFSATEEEGAPARAAGLRRGFKREENPVRLDRAETVNVIGTLTLDAASLAALANDPETKELKNDFRVINRFRTVYSIWREQAQRVAEGLFYKEKREDYKIINASIKACDELYAKAIEELNAGPEAGFSKKLLTGAFDAMKKAESEEDIIGKADLKSIRDILEAPEDADEEARIFSKMRYGGWSGNSEGVKAHILESATAKGGAFENVGAALENPATIAAIESGDVAAVRKSVEPNLSESTAKEVCSAYDKMQSRWAKSRAKYKESLREQNPGISNEDLLAKLEDAEKISMHVGILDIYRDAAMYDLVSRMEDRTAKGKLIEEYAGLKGLGTKDKWYRDAFSVSDENIDTVIDVSSTLALAAVSMGVGALAARGAMLAATYGARAARVAALAQKLAQGGKAGRFAAGSLRASGTVAGIAIEGVAFYEGSNFANHAITGGWDKFLEDAGNTAEIAKSVAFMGALRAMGKVAAMPKVVKMTEKIPSGIAKSTAGVLAEAAGITATSFVLDNYGHQIPLLGGVFNEDSVRDMSWGEYLQAVAMVMMMRKAGKIFERKDGAADYRDVALKAYEAKLKDPKLSTYDRAMVENRINQLRSELDLRDSKKSGPREPDSGPRGDKRAIMEAYKEYLKKPDSSARDRATTERRIETLESELSAGGKGTPAEQYRKAEDRRAARRRELVEERKAQRRAAASASSEAAPAPKPEPAIAPEPAKAAPAKPSEPAGLPPSEPRLVNLEPHVALSELRVGENLRLGTLAEGGHWVGIRKIGAEKFAVTEVRDGAPLAPKEILDLRFMPESDGKIWTKIVGFASDGSPYEYANVRQPF